MNTPSFFLVGINYKKSDASVRGSFAINHEQYAGLLEKANSIGLTEVFVLSTCNRTEIYGLASSSEVLIDLISSASNGDQELFRQLCYIKEGKEAIAHIFEVGAGLDSQILGDYEIVGQLKLAVKFAREHKMIGCFLDRLINTVLQSSKSVKNQTEISNGTVSVSFAAIQFLKKNVADISNKKILLVGTGKIGTNTCKNIIDYLGTRNITLINRTEEKAAQIATELGLNVAPFHQFKALLQEADIIIVATNAAQPVVLSTDLPPSKTKILIDLSIPNNIEPSIKNLPFITLANVDDLSKINDETLRKRTAEIPKATAIITTHINEFIEWNNMRRHVPILKTLKQQLTDMHSCNFFQSITLENQGFTVSSTPETIQKVVNNMAVKMRNQPQLGCNYIEAINDFIAATT